MAAPASNWPLLLERALAILDGAAPVPATRPWTLGGGTALAIRHAHRVSFDIDIFTGGLPLQTLVPQRNAVGRAFGVPVQWPGHYVKYEFPEGEIDFLGPGVLTDPGSEPYDFRGRSIQLETAEEIAIKKIRYRGSRLTPRDVFDIAFVDASDPMFRTALRNHVSDVLPRAIESVRMIAADGGDALVARSIVPTASGRTAIGGSTRRCLEAFEAALGMPADDGPSI